MSSGLTQAAQSKDEALLQQRLFEWLSQDHLRLTLLAQVAECAALHPMPQWCIAAGFVRNLVWDRLHGLAPMPLADIDVIYYCPQDVSRQRDRAIEDALRHVAPDLPWSVKNQARMHVKHQDAPYLSCIDAMAHWPEIETAVGIGYSKSGAESSMAAGYRLYAPFGLQSLFALTLTPNPRRAMAVFQQRLADKGWLVRYPLLTLARGE